MTISLRHAVHGVALFAASHLFAATYFVDANRPDDNGAGTSWVTAKKTIQAAVDLTTRGDTVLVTNGIYNQGSRITPGFTLANRVVITNDIVVKSIHGASETFIEGSGSEHFGTENAIRCVYMSRGSLEGFSLINGATLAYPTYASPFDHQGGGIYMVAQSMGTALKNSIIANCKATSGGGAAKGRISNSLLHNNIAVQHGGATWECASINCTMSKNTAGLGGGTVLGWSYNCIIWGNTLLNGSSNNYHDSDVASSWTTSNPLFVDAENNDFHLSNSSPCRDTGDNFYALGPCDLDGNTRIYTNKVDFGAFENGSSKHIPDVNIGEPSTFFVDAARPDDSGDGSSWLTAKKTIQAAIALTIDGDRVIVTNGVYNVGTTVIPGYTLRNRVVITNQITVQSVNGAKTTIIEGSGSSHFSLPSAVRCVFMSKGLLDGFTLKDGATLAHPAYPHPFEHRGGGVCMAGFALDAEIRNSIIENCKATSGGGTANGRVNNCVLWKNAAIQHGGGSWECNLLSSTLTKNAATAGGGSASDRSFNCIICDNTATDLPYYNCYASESDASWVSNSPGFVDPLNGDFHLLPNSPCRDNGHNLFSTTSYDIEGQDRILNQTIDFGAHEYALSITVVFDPNGGEVQPLSQTATFGKVYGLLPMPTPPFSTRVKPMFDGWFTEEGHPITAASLVTTPANHTLHARWTTPAYLSDPADDDLLTGTGAYDGYLFAEQDFGDHSAVSVLGTFTLNITSLAGKFTAKAVTRNGVFAFNSRAWSSVDEGDGTCSATVTLNGGERLDLHVRQNRIWGSLAGGKLGDETLTLDGARNRFKDRSDAAAQAALSVFTGYYTASLPVLETLALGAADAAPQGTGYLTLQIGAGGSAKVAGVLADGTSLSMSSRALLFDDAGGWVCVPVFAPFNTRKGWIGGLLWINPDTRAVVTDRELGWLLRWEQGKGWPTDFAELLDVCGGFYVKPPALAPAYRFGVEIGPVPYFFTGGSVDFVAEALPVDLGVTASAAGMVIEKGTWPQLTAGGYVYGGPNSALASLNFSPLTGVFRGTFYVYYDYLLLNGRLQHKKAQVLYAGVITPVRGDAFEEEPAGSGYCLVPDNDPLVKPYNLKRSFPSTLKTLPR